MDDRLDTFLQDTYTWILHNAPYYVSIAYNYASTTAAHLFHLSRITARAVIHAHMPSSWVFLGRNGYPLMLKEGDISHETLASLLTYNPTTRSFCPTGPRDSKTRLDVVTAELVDASGIVFHDLSSFFYAVSWVPTAAAGIPSILELVLVFALENQFYLPLSTLETFTVRILDSNCETHTISLASDEAREPFTGFVAGEAEKVQESKEDTDAALR